LSEKTAPSNEVSVSKIESFIGLIESFSRYHRTLSVVIAVFIADIVTAAVSGKNFTAWSWEDAIQLASLGLLLVALLVYGLVTSLVVPALYEFLGCLARRFTRLGVVDDSRPVGSVSATELQDFADAEQSEYAKRACSEAQALRAADRAAASLAGRYSLAVASLLGLNLWVVSPRHPTATAALFEYLGEPAAVAVIAVATVITFVSWHVKPREWIRFVPAYRAVVDETGPFEPTQVAVPPFSSR